MKSVITAESNGGTKIVEVPTIQVPIAASPGFAKKELSEFKLDIMGLCQFGCVYCSSNSGNYLRIQQKPFLDLTEVQTGERSRPIDDPKLMFAWPEILERLDDQLSSKQPCWGQGKTLVFSMLTDGFSPHLVQSGTTEAALRKVLDHTSFRIRVLTKNPVVGTSRWIRFFQDFPDRFVVGLSVGTLDDAWAKRIERRIPPTRQRLKALQALQDADIPTFGMLCPAFPHTLEGDHLERLVEAIRPERNEHVWAEPFNDRKCWRAIHDCLDPSGRDAVWLQRVYDDGDRGLWSSYATELYQRLRCQAEAGDWLNKLRYLLYEGNIAKHDAPAFRGFEGVLLQSKPNDAGLSRNPAFAELQTV